jgi:hypothetical protein
LSDEVHLLDMLVLLVLDASLQVLQAIHCARKVRIELVGGVLLLLTLAFDDGHLVALTSAGSSKMAYDAREKGQALASLR